MQHKIIDPKYHFITLFDDETGVYVRSGMIKKSRDTGVDPFMASFPHLIDVGVMGHCIHGKTGLCRKAGIGCYQDGAVTEKPNMTVDDFRWIAAQCRGRTNQLALGGRGDPDQHERFKELLQISRENGLVPSFTTSGYGLTPELAAVCRKYCGAVAVSWYRGTYTQAAIQMLLDAGVKTNIHYVLVKNSIRISSLAASWKRNRQIRCIGSTFGWFLRLSKSIAQKEHLDYRPVSATLSRSFHYDRKNGETLEEKCGYGGFVEVNFNIDDLDAKMSFSEDDLQFDLGLLEDDGEDNLEEKPGFELKRWRDGQLPPPL